MKKYLIICFSIVLFLFGIYYLYFYTSFTLISHEDVQASIKTDGKSFMLNNNNFSIKAISLSMTIPQSDGISKNISKATYLRWFELIQDMNVNSIQIATIASPEFYQALKEYNLNNDTPLYLIQGIDAGSYEKNSTADYFDKSLKDKLIRDAKIMIDVIHGKRIIANSSVYPSGRFLSDVSKWTIAYIIGTEWNDVTVEYTNQLRKEDTVYEGTYLKTTEDSKPFERILTEIGDKIISYESRKYGEQRLISFGNTPQTDPFQYDIAITDYFNKFTTIDMEHIKQTDKVKSGLFASYQAYSSYPDYYSLSEIAYEDTYYEYLKSLNIHHTIPVIISEFGYSTSRSTQKNTLNVNYGNGIYTEEEQGKMIIKSINTMKKAGISGFVIREWQDNWANNTWNTMHAVDTTRSSYWHDVETSTQGYGILSFDPGKKETKVVLDGKKEEWTKEDIVLKDNELTLSAKYDQVYLYLLVEKNNLDLDNDILYIPIDTTNRSGTKTSDIDNLTFDQNVDFLIKINGNDNSKIMVQERYNTLRAVYGRKVYFTDSYEKDNIPRKDSNKFEDIYLITSTQNLLRENGTYLIQNEVTRVNTGKLTYGNGNPNSKEYNSLSDYYSSGNQIEIRIPWQLLNFSDPTKMKIHDDYYEKYGVESYEIDKIQLGLGDGSKTISLKEYKLEKKKQEASYHERLKKSYQIIKDGLKKGE